MKIDNLIDHNLFNSQFPNITVDSSDYQKKFVSGFSSWNRSESDPLKVLYNGLDVCEGLIFGGDYRTQTIEYIEHDYPDSLKLALEIENIIKSGAINKSSTKKNAISLIDISNEWVKRAGDKIPNFTPPNLRRFIGITPLFKKKQLSEKASKHFDFDSELIVINGYNHYIAFFTLKSDNTRVWSYISPDTNKPPQIQPIRRRWRDKKLIKLLNSEHINYGLI